MLRLLLSPLGLILLAISAVAAAFILIKSPAERASAALKNAGEALRGVSDAQGQLAQSSDDINAAHDKLTKSRGRLTALQIEGTASARELARAEMDVLNAERTLTAAQLQRQEVVEALIEAEVKHRSEVKKSKDLLALFGGELIRVFQSQERGHLLAFEGGLSRVRTQLANLLPEMREAGLSTQDFDDIIASLPRDSASASDAIGELQRVFGLVKGDADAVQQTMTILGDEFKENSESVLLSGKALEMFETALLNQVIPALALGNVSLPQFVEMLKLLPPEAAAAASALASELVPGFNIIPETVAEAKEAVIKDFNDLGDNFKVFAGKTKKEFVEWKRDIQGTFTDVSGILSDLAEDADVSMTDIIKAFRRQARQLVRFEEDHKKFQQKLSQIYKGDIPPVIQEFTTELLGMGLEGRHIMEALSGATKKEIEAFAAHLRRGKGATRNIVDGLQSVVEKLDRVIDKLAELNGIDLKDKSLTVVVNAKGDVAALSGHGGRITARAHGTITRGPELALIGEAGPEAVIPLSDATRNRRMELLRQSGIINELLGIGMANGGVVGRGPAGFARDFEQLGDRVGERIDELRELMADMGEKEREEARRSIEELKGLRREANALAAKMERVAERIQAMNQAVQSAFSGLRDISSVAGGTANDLKVLLGGNAKVAEQLNTGITQLADKGLNQKLLQQIIELGPEALPLIESLNQASKPTIAKINENFESIGAFSQETSKALRDRLMPASEQLARSFERLSARAESLQVAPLPSKGDGGNIIFENNTFGSVMSPEDLAQEVSWQQRTHGF